MFSIDLALVSCFLPSLPCSSTVVLVHSNVVEVVRVSYVHTVVCKVCERGDSESIFNLHRSITFSSDVLFSEINKIT